MARDSTKDNRGLAMTFHSSIFILLCRLSSVVTLTLIIPGVLRADVLVSVDEIHAEPIIQEALRTIEDRQDANIQRLIELTEIPAPPFAEEERAREVLAQFKAAGLVDAYIDDVGNVIARRRGLEGGRSIAFVAHMDTVYPKGTVIKVRREGTLLHAPGIGDNTQALVAMLTLAEVLQELEIETRDDIVFVGSVGEEGLGDLRGVRHLLGDDGIAIDSFIAMDGGEISRVVVDGAGSNRYRVEFAGPGGHSYGAFGRAHPHQALAEAIARFTDLALPITRQGEKATFSVGRIGGGTSINSIPFSSWMEVDMRSADSAKLAKLDAALREAVQYALDRENKRYTEGPPLTVTIESVGARPAGRGDRNSSLVTNAVAALLELGVTADLTASSTDSNIAIAKGIPAVTIARGGVAENSHAPNEYWDSTDGHLGAQSALLLVTAEAGLIVSPE